jgi:hypothetical protein
MGSSLMYFMPGWQEKSMQVRTLHAVGDGFQDMTLIQPAISNHENNLFKVRYFDVANQGFPDWRSMQLLLLCDQGKRPRE